MFLTHLRSRYPFLYLWVILRGGLRFWILGLRSSFSTHPTYEQYGGCNLFQNSEFKVNFSIKVWRKCWLSHVSCFFAVPCCFKRYFARWIFTSAVACVASVSVRFRSKERGKRVKDFSRVQNRKSRSSVFLYSETKRRLPRRLSYRAIERGHSVFLRLHINSGQLWHGHAKYNFSLVST